MSDQTFLDWPFFDARHRDLAAALDAWCSANLPVDHANTAARCEGQSQWFSAAWHLNRQIETISGRPENASELAGLYVRLANAYESQNDVRLEPDAVAALEHAIHVDPSKTPLLP